MNKLPIPLWNFSSSLYNGLKPIISPRTLISSPLPYTNHELQNLNTYHPQEFQVSLYNENFTRCSFIDDTTLYCYFLSSLIKLIHLTDYGQNLYMLPYNSTKFEIMYIKNYCTQNIDNIDMSFNGNLLSITDNIKIVGFYLNKNNSLKHQLLHVTNKINLFLHSLESNVICYLQLDISHISHLAFFIFVHLVFAK